MQFNSTLYWLNALSDKKLIYLTQRLVEYCFHYVGRELRQGFLEILCSKFLSFLFDQYYKNMQKL